MQEPSSPSCMCKWVSGARPKEDFLPFGFQGQSCRRPVWKAPRFSADKRGQGGALFPFASEQSQLQGSLPSTGYGYVGHLLSMGACAWMAILNEVSEVELGTIRTEGKAGWEDVGRRVREEKGRRRKIREEKARRRRRRRSRREKVKSPETLCYSSVLWLRRMDRCGPIMRHER